jgi:Erv1 / Alr family/Thioredoxin
MGWFVQGRRQRWTSIRVLLLLLLLRMVLLLAAAHHTTSSSSSSQADGNPKPLTNNTAARSFPYLYGVPGNPNASFPVQEHFAPIHRVPNSNPNTTIAVDEQQQPDRPDFLFTDTGTYRLVEFYVHWCDVCKNFKPHYIELARRLQQLAAQSALSSASLSSQQIDVHAVSCAPNRPLCRELAIDRYPYFRVLVPGDTGGGGGGVDVPHAQVHPSTILQKMGLAVADEDLESDWNVEQPAISSSTVTSTRGIWSWLLGMASQSQDETVPGKYHYKRSRDELRDDVHLSFDYAMRQGVFVSNDPLTLERSVLLFEWLVLLRNTLPVSWTTLHHAVQGLIDNFDYVKRSEEYMVSILDEYSPPPLSSSPSSSSSSFSSAVWSVACSHGEADAGYTCGLWQLLHVVTVGVVDYNRAAAFAHSRLATETVARTIRNYIEAFFGCEKCRTNFVADFDACAFRRCDRLLVDSTGDEADWIQLPLWLFETHNAVNVRLQAEKAAREQQPHPTKDDAKLVLWPPVKDCPQCWHTDQDNYDTIWNDDAVYKYLKVEYGQRDAISMEYKRELFALQNTTTSLSSLPLNHKSTYNSSVWTWFASYFYTAEENSSYRQRTTKELVRDAHVALDCMLRNGVHVDNLPIVHTRRVALKEWLTLLHTTIPSSWTTLRYLVRELLDNFSFVLASKDYMVAVLDDYRPSEPMDQFVCQQGGATNGLWDLFHVVAAGTADTVQNQAAAGERRALIHDRAKTILETFKAFVDCDACSMVLAESLASSVSNSDVSDDWTKLALWLAAAHHAVVRRSSENQAYWPPKEACDVCWSETGKINKEVTYAFLEQEYNRRLTVGDQEEL